LAFRGIDLGELWRARQWRKLLNLIEHLPRNSFFNEARANDPEVAEYLATQPLGESEERLSNWDSTVEMLALIADRLGLVATITAAAAGYKDLKIDPVKRPTTEIQRVRESSEESTGRRLWGSLKHRLLPKEDD
jgi:hypothetical protein